MWKLSAIMMMVLSITLSAGDAYLGTWEGVKEDGRINKELPWGPVEITRNDNGEIKVRVINLADSGHSWDMPNVKFSHGKMISKGRLDIEASLKHHGHVLAGRMKHHGMTEQFTLKRIKPRSADQIVADFHKDPAQAEIPSQSQFIDVLKTKSVDHARAIMEAVRMRKDHPQLFAAQTVNALGYAYLQKDNTEKAIEVFKLNVDAYPDDANSYDSLGEAYVTAGKRDLAIKALKTSLSMDPHKLVRENSIKLLKKLGIEHKEAIN